MAFSLDGATISTADATTGWSVIAPAAGLSGGQGGSNAVPALEGSGTVEFHLGANQDGGLKSPVVTAYDCRDFETGVWLLNPKENGGGSELIDQTAVGVRLRLYSGANWADFNQPDVRLPTGDWPGGWMYLRASGGPGDEDSNSGTWGATQCASVDSCAVMINAAASNTGKNDLEYQVDYAKYYSTITVTGTETLSSLFSASQTNDWGIVNQFANYYSLFAGLQINGTLNCENEVIALNHSSPTMLYDILVNGTLNLGQKNVQTQATYAQSGVQVLANGARPGFTIASAGDLNAYASLIKNFDVVNLGSGGSSGIELIKCDFYDNNAVEFRSTGLTADNIRIHTDSTSKKNLGGVYNVPSSMSRLRVFNCLNALDFKGTQTVNEYVAGDTTNDVVVANNQTLTLINSSFNSSKVAQS